MLGDGKGSEIKTSSGHFRVAVGRGKLVGLGVQGTFSRIYLHMLQREIAEGDIPSGYLT